MKNFLLFLAVSLFNISLKAQTTISSSVSFAQIDADNDSWPITITGGATVTLTEDIVLTQPNQYFIIGSDGVNFAGANYTVTIDNATDYPGLFQDNGFSTILINNVKVHSNSSNLQDSGGWIGQSNFSNGAVNDTIRNCSSDGDVNNFAGGITGSNSSCTVTNSHSSGSIIFASGGIFGAYSSGTAINCYSTGNGQSYCGGIFGYNGSGNASDCYSTGSIGFDGGGILGYYFFGSALRCYSTGDIGQDGGGIAGSEFYGVIDNCYSTGTIGNESGGITGSVSGGTITNSYCTGLEDGGNGVAGLDNWGSLSNCFSEDDGIWKDENALTFLIIGAGAWSDIDLTADNIPYKLSSFNTLLYSPSTENIPANPLINSPEGNLTTGSYSLVSINGDVPSLNPSVSIDAVSGMISFTNAGIGSFINKILYTDNSDGSYQVSDYTLNVLSTLPLTWRSFTVTPRGSAAWLQWSTSSEQNTRDFSAEHSIDGSSWTTIGTVAAAGNSTTTSNYNYLHTDPVIGNNYYRIRQADLDGRYSYSAIQKLQITSAGKSFSVINTIVTNGIVQVSVKTNTLLYLYSNDGQLLWQKQLTTGLQDIDCSIFPKGIYFLKGKDAVEKIIVQ